MSTSRSKRSTVQQERYILFLRNRGFAAHGQSRRTRKFDREQHQIETLTAGLSCTVNIECSDDSADFFCGGALLYQALAPCVCLSAGVLHPAEFGRCSCCSGV